MNRRSLLALSVMCVVAAACLVCQAQEQQERFLGPLNMDVPHISTDDSVRYGTSAPLQRRP